MVDEGQHRDGLVTRCIWLGDRRRRLPSCFRFSLWLQYKLVNCEVAERQDQDEDDREVELLAGFLGDGLAAVDVFFFFQAFRGQFESPREQQGQRKTDDQQQQDGLYDPLGGSEGLEKNVCDLGEQPRQDDISRADLEDVAPFQLLEQPGHYLIIPCKTLQSMRLPEG